MITVYTALGLPGPPRTFLPKEVKDPWIGKQPAGGIWVAKEASSGTYVKKQAAGGSWVKKKDV